MQRGRWPEIGAESQKLGAESTVFPGLKVVAPLGFPGPVANFARVQAVRERALPALYWHP